MQGGFDRGDQLGSGGQQRATVNVNDGICPVTIRQILTATFDQDNQEVRIDNNPRKQICIVAKTIAHTEETVTDIVYTINDGTGTFKVKFFASDLNTEVYKDGTYVFIVGRLSAQSRTEMTDFTIRKVTEFDQIPFHMLQATFTHLQAVKGSAPNSIFSAQVTQPQAVAQHVAQTTQQLTTEQKAEQIKTDVVNFIHAQAGDSGVAFTTICSAFASKYSTEDVRTAIESASFNGEIYATNEEDHYAPC